jgi:hypothetical protein
MRFKLRTLFIVVLLAAIATPVSIQLYRHYHPRPFFVGPTVFLCIASGNDHITHTHVRNLLSSKGINSISEGSIVYGTTVEKARLEEAIKLLEKSASDGLPTIKLHRDERGSLWVSGDESLHFNERFEIHINEIIESADRHANLILAIKNSAPSSYLTRDRLPFVLSLSGFERKYLDNDGTMQSGYVVDLELANRLVNPTARFTECYQIMDNFRYVKFTGGNGTGGLPDMP